MGVGSEPPTPQRELLYNWDFTQSLTDTIGNLTFSLLNSNGGTSLPTQDSTGLHFTAAEQVARCTSYAGRTANGRLYEIDISEAQFAGDNSKHKRFFGFENGSFLLIFKNSGAVQIYVSSWAQYTAEPGQTIPTSMNAFSGKTIGIELGTDFTAYFYIDHVLTGKRRWTPNDRSMDSIYIGGKSSGTKSDGNQIYNCTITGLRVYAPLS